MIRDFELRTPDSVVGSRATIVPIELSASKMVAMHRNSFKGLLPKARSAALRRAFASVIAVLFASHAASAAIDRELEMQVRQFVRQTNPSFQQSTPVVLEEYVVPGLAEQSRARLYLARLLGSSGEQFNELLFIHYNNTITPLGQTFGGHGLMSAVMFERRLHYSLSWGSGVHRSQLGTVSFSRGQAKAEQSQGVPNIDLFVRVEGENLIVESGRYAGFNEWRGAKQNGGFHQAWADANKGGSISPAGALTNTGAAQPERIPMDSDQAILAWMRNHLLPKSGQAASLQGELLRAVEKLRMEAKVNGNINWDDGFVRFVEFLQRHLQAETKFDEKAQAEIAADLHRLASFRLFDDIQEDVRDHQLPPAGRAYINDDLYDRLVARIVEYGRFHPDLIPLPADPAQYR